MSKYNFTNHSFYLIVLASAIATRIVPHAWNFAPVTAIALVAAVYLPKRDAIALPLAIRFISDLLIGFFPVPQMIAVYLAHLVGVAMGLWVKQNKTLPRVLTAPIVSAVAFFLVTNFAFLYRASEYTHDWAGIVLAYTNGLPFFRGTLLGDVIYTVTLVGAVEGVRAWRAHRTQVRSAAV